MSVLVVAAEHLPPGWHRYGQLLAIFFSAFGYSTAVRTLRTASASFEAQYLSDGPRYEVSARITALDNDLKALRELSESEPDRKHRLAATYDMLSQEKRRLLEREHELEDSLLVSARRNRSAADLMLLLMVLSVVGSIALAVLHLFVAAPVVLGTAAPAFIAYQRAE